MDATLLPLWALAVCLYSIAAKKVKVVKVKLCNSAGGHYLLLEQPAVCVSSMQIEWLDMNWKSYIHNSRHIWSFLRHRPPNFKVQMLLFENCCLLGPIPFLLHFTAQVAWNGREYLFLARAAGRLLQIYGGWLDWRGGKKTNRKSWETERGIIEGGRRMQRGQSWRCERRIIGRRLLKHWCTPPWLRLPICQQFSWK